MSGVLRRPGRRLESPVRLRRARCVTGACETSGVDVGSRRERRRSARVLRQMDRAARRRSRSRTLLGDLLVVLGAVVLAVGAGLWVHPGGWDLSELVRPQVYVQVDGEAVAVPRPDASDGRVRPAVAVTTSGSYAFLHTAPDGSPVGYDPCRPVRYVVNTSGMPPSGQLVVDDAVQVVAEASGLALVPVGTTDEEPRVERPLIQPDRYGPGWAPVLVAWSDGATVPELAGQVAGVGGSAAVPGADGSGTWLAGGRLLLDAEDLGALLASPEGYPQARAIVVHELAHVLGLDHVDDPGELMHPTTSSWTELGPGDRQALALVGQVACEE